MWAPELSANTIDFVSQYGRSDLIPLIQERTKRPNVPKWGINKWVKEGTQFMAKMLSMRDFDFTKIRTTFGLDEVTPKFEIEERQDG